MKFIGFVWLFCCCAGLAKSQPNVARPVQGKNDTIKVNATVLDGELVPWFVIPEVKIVDTRIFKSQQERNEYMRLRYNVYKVLPYVRFANSRYQQLQRDLAITADKGKQKELIAACEKEVKDLFSKEIKNLTISQGEVLIKLVNRETGNTSYDMVKDLKGGFNAFIFQSVARVFGHNLKETYDPDKERDIESILRSAGYVTYNN